MLLSTAYLLLTFLTLILHIRAEYIEYADNEPGGGNTPPSLVNDSFVDEPHGVFLIRYELDPVCMLPSCSLPLSRLSLYQFRHPSLSGPLLAQGMLHGI